MAHRQRKAPAPSAPVVALVRDPERDWRGSIVEILGVTGRFRVTGRFACSNDWFALLQPVNSEQRFSYAAPYRLLHLSERSGGAHGRA